MFLDATVGVTTSFSQPLRPWFDVKSCGESVEVGAMVIYTDILIDIFRVVSSRESFVFEPRTTEVIRSVNNIFLSCKQEHKCPDQGTR